MEKYRIENYYRKFGSLHGTGKCVVCGDEFKCKFVNSRAKYCSLECRNKMAKRRSMEKAKKFRSTFNKCTMCENSIKQKDAGKIRRYCSNECRQRSYRLRNKQKV